MVKPSEREDMINKSELFEYILGGFKSALGIASPSKVMRDHYEIYAEEERKKKESRKVIK